MIRCCLVALLLMAPVGASAQYESPAAAAAAKGGGLPPFLASMKRHDLTVDVGVYAPDGSVAPAGAGLSVGLSIVAGGAKVRDYMARTDDAGAAKLSGIPSNAEVQRSITYEAWVDYNGVRYPFKLDGVPSDGSRVALNIFPVSDSLAAITSEQFVTLTADEESLVASHTIRLYNESSEAIALGGLPGGGLALPCPEGAKHPELRDEHSKLAEARGTSIIYKGALLPRGQGPAVISFIYTIPYKTDLFEWAQSMPVKLRSFTAVVPLHKETRHQSTVPLGLFTRAQYGATDIVDQGGGRRVQVLRSGGSVLQAGDTLRFAVDGLPAPSPLPNILLVAAVFAVILIVFFGYRRQEGDRGAQLSLSHLEEERDRLVKALARIRKAHERGRLPTKRFEKEQEAITARLVSLYRAIDALEAT